MVCSKNINIIKNNLLCNCVLTSNSFIIIKGLEQHLKDNNTR